MYMSEIIHISECALDERSYFLGKRMYFYYKGLFCKA